MTDALQRILIAASRYLWLNQHLSHEDYDWFLVVIRATPEDVYRSPFWY